MYISDDAVVSGSDAVASAKAGDRAVFHRERAGGWPADSVTRRRTRPRRPGDRKSIQVDRDVVRGDVDGVAGGARNRQIAGQTITSRVDYHVGKPAGREHLGL